MEVKSAKAERKKKKEERRKRTTVWRMGIFWVIGCVLCLYDAEAVTPKIWRENSQVAFEKGEVEGISLTREGTVTLSPQLEKVADTDENFVWSLVSDDRGNVYFGTGVEGRIYQFKNGQKMPEVIFDTEEEAKIFSLAIGSDGALYAGTSPGGLIYRVVPGKPAEVFCQTGDLHVWALLPREGGGLFVGTGGEQGRILKVSQQGEVAEIYKSQDPNVVSLAQGAGGVLYAGTDQSGLIYRISQAGKVSAFYDAGEKEVHALASGLDGTVYAAAMAGRSEPKKNGNGEGGSKQSVLYAIRPSGTALRLWEVDDPLLLQVVVDQDGTLRVVTGQKGRVYRVWPDGKYSLLTQLKDVHPWAVLARQDGSLWIGSSGDGQVFRLPKSYGQKGLLTSKPQDFTLVSHWGRVYWQAEEPTGTSVSVQTRSGNSEEPDDTWEDWSKPLKTTGSQITSKPARFLQYRVTLVSSNDATPQLRDIRLAGLQENVPPVVLSLKAEPVHNGDNDEKKNRDTHGLWKINWEAGDVNDDQLVYSLYFKNVADTRWLLLKESFRGLNYLWDTETVPDGQVHMRVVASDEGSNPVAQSLFAEVASAPFEIDNTAPHVILQAIRPMGQGTVAVAGTVEDQISAIVSAKYAINSGDWQVIFSEDSIFDSPKEMLQFNIGNLKAGVYSLVVQAADALGNVGAGKTVFEVK